MHKILEQGSEVGLVLLLMTPLMIAFLKIYENLHLMGG